MTMENKKFRSERSSLSALDDKVLAVPINFPMSKYHPMFEEFSDKMLRFLEAGGRGSENSRFKHHSEEIPALVLSMDDLRIGFLACLVPLAISSVVFVIEIMIFKIRKVATELRNNFLGFYALWTFLNSQQESLQAL